MNPPTLGRMSPSWVSPFWLPEENPHLELSNKAIQNIISFPEFVLFQSTNLFLFITSTGFSLWVGFNYPLEQRHGLLNIKIS